jgi:hypothetical protein
MRLNSQSVLERRLEVNPSRSVQQTTIVNKAADILFRKNWPVLKAQSQDATSLAEAVEQIKRNISNGKRTLAA